MWLQPSELKKCSLLDRDLLGCRLKTESFFLIIATIIGFPPDQVSSALEGLSVPEQAVGIQGRGREKRNVLMQRLILGCLEGETAVPRSNSSSFMTVCNYSVIA